MSNKFDTNIIGIDLLNPKSISVVQERLKKIFLPWEPDDSCPPRYVRKDGMGEQVAIVDSWLGGYAEPHTPELHGWGYSSCPLGQGSSCRGIRKSKMGAMQAVDEFLASSFEDLGYLILIPVLIG